MSDQRGIGHPHINDWCGKQGSKLGYLQWHADAEKRHERDERQSYCLTCYKWRWPDELCEDSEVDKAAEAARRFEMILGEVVKITSDNQILNGPNGPVWWQDVVRLDDDCCLGNGNMADVTVREAFQKGKLFIQQKTGLPMYDVEIQ